MAQLVAERIALDEMEPRWVSQGYRLIRDPTRGQLPDFLGSYRPDAIAVGKEPGLIIEVINPRGRSTKTKVSQIRELIAGNPNWKLEVVYSPTDSVAIGAASRTSIEEALAQAEALADTEPRAGLLLAWAGLEAIGRMLHPALADYSMSTGSLVDLLVSQGNLAMETQRDLRRLGEVRNKIAHGQLDLDPSQQDIRGLLKLARSML